LRTAKREESFLQLSLSVHSDVYTKLCGKSRGDGRKFIIYTVRLISLRKNLSGVRKFVLEGKRRNCFITFLPLSRGENLQSADKCLFPRSDHILRVVISEYKLLLSANELTNCE